MTVANADAGIEVSRMLPDTLIYNFPTLAFIMLDVLPATVPFPAFVRPSELRSWNKCGTATLGG